MSGKKDVDPFEGWAHGENGARIYTLEFPVTIKFTAPGTGERTEVLDKVSIRRATGFDLDLIDQYSAAPMRLVKATIAQLSGLDQALVNRIDTEDLGPLGAAAMCRLEGGQKTGAII